MKLHIKPIHFIVSLECLILGILLWIPHQTPAPASGTVAPSETSSYIKWVDFDVTSAAMKKAFRYDVDTYQQPIHLNWIDLLAYLGAKYGGDFSKYRERDMASLAEKLQSGTPLEELIGDMKYFTYYREAYGAVLGGMVGTYEIQIPASKAPDFYQIPDSAGHTADADANANVGTNANTDTNTNVDTGTNANTGTNTHVDTDSTGPLVWVRQYGLKSFLPIAKNYPYHDFDDFGVSRSYGFRRQHLGHDMMGQVGSPIIAVESGYVEAIGWNQYGGWRLGIRSFDRKRYYYYAHLRKNYPYHKSLQEGSVVQAGDVIGYLGRTGYSRTENTNNINDPHLHFGIQLIFDESQKEGNNEIWIDCYEITKFLTLQRSETIKNQETKEYSRVYQMKDPAIPGEIPYQQNSTGGSAAIN